MEKTFNGLIPITFPIKFLQYSLHKESFCSTPHSLCSDYNKQEGVLYLLLEYAEMDLNAVIKNWNRANHMLNVLYFWNQMLLAVKVTSSV